MRKMKEFYLDKSRNSLEVRFDDGGASIKLKGTDSKHLVVALLSLASEIQRLEAKTHVGQLRADSNRVKASMERIKNAPGLDRP